MAAEVAKLKEKIYSQDYELQKLRDSAKRIQNDKQAHSENARELLAEIETLKLKFEAEKESMQVLKIYLLMFNLLGKIR